MPTFELVVVGSGGGPDETNISGYLLKSCTASWEDGIIALEAGSTLGALRRILDEKPHLFRHPKDTDRCYSAARIYSLVQCFVISHAHLDHIMGLILLAGSYQGARKSIMGARRVLKDIESIFGPGRLWPNLASWDKKDQTKPYLFEPLLADGKYKKVHGEISFRMMPLSHQSQPAQYDSSAFFVRHDPSGKEFLFFGDMEPDVVSRRPQTLHVWKAAAEMFPDQLNTVFIECSWPSGRDNAHLYGHLTPEHLIRELEAFALEVLRYRAQSSVQDTYGSSPARKRLRTHVSVDGAQLRGALNGLRVFVMHCKYDINDRFTVPIHEVITGQVRDLSEQKGLGVEIFHADQGTLIEI